MLTAFAIAFFFVLIAEMGDKTQARRADICHSL